jgi:N-acetylglucosaminyl-diphospho-decaprenol L-rhamnosyltransferase
MGEHSGVDLSYCVVNTDGRDLLLACLDAIEREGASLGGLDWEVLVLDNASRDGSAEAVRREHPDARLIAQERRSGKAESDSRLLQEARGTYCLLLNEDSELQPGAPKALIDALEADPKAAAAGAQLIASDGSPVPCAWRLPGAGTALAGALFLHRRLTVESGGAETRKVGWAQSSAMLVRRRAAEQVGWLDPDFFVYSDETDFCKRLADAGWHILYVPDARAIHHDQMASDAAGVERRIVEYHRNRDLYLRKHKGRLAAILLRPLLAWPYLARAIGAVFLPSHSSRRYWLHARQGIRPGRGEGIREAAEDYNRRMQAQPTGVPR